jgi:capsular exopolysaccharide synthesis family protein
MDQTSDRATIRDYIRVLRARWLVIALTVGVALAIGIAYCVLRDPVYSATTKIEFRGDDADFDVVSPGVVQTDLTPEKSAAAQANVVTSNAVLEAVQRHGYADLSTDELRNRVDVSVEADSNLVAIEASAPEARAAADLAETFAQETRAASRRQNRARFARQADALEAALDRGHLDPITKGNYKATIARLRTLANVADPVTIASPAEVPDDPSAPQPVRDLLLAGVLGVLVGVGLAYMRNALDRRVRDSREIQAEIGYPLVGYVPDEILGLAGASRNGVDSAEKVETQDELEAFRIIRTNVQFLGDRHISSLVVTSPVAEEGKSTVAAGYAYASAAAGHRTLLVDCDLRRPVLGDRFGVEAAPGLSDVLAGNVELADALRSIPVHSAESADPLSLIPAGASVFQPSEMIGSDRFARFLDEVEKTYDAVVFDSAPLLPVGDTRELVVRVDAILVCVRMEQTTSDQVGRAKEVLERLPNRAVGLVITGVTRGREDGYYAYQYAHLARAAPKS